MTNDIDALKQLLIKLYFPQYQNKDMHLVHLRITYKDNKLLKLLLLPKSVFRRYELLVQDAEKKVFSKKLIPHKEKESVKYFVEMINKNTDDR